MTTRGPNLDHYGTYPGTSPTDLDPDRLRAAMDLLTTPWEPGVKNAVDAPQASERLVAPSNAEVPPIVELDQQENNGISGARAALALALSKPRP